MNVSCSSVGMPTSSATAFVPVVGTVTALSSRFVFRAAAAGTSIRFSWGWYATKARNVQNCSGLLYTKGLTTEQIVEISDCVYGRAYSKQQVSHLAGSCRDDVERWLGRSLSSHYLPSTLMPPLSPRAGTGRCPRRPTTPFWGCWRTAAGRCSPLSITPLRVPCAGKTSLRHWGKEASSR